MKAKYLIAAIIIISLCVCAFCACDVLGEKNVTTVDTTSSITSKEAKVQAAAVDETFSEITDTTEEFSITTSDGEYSKIDNVYTITKGGTYSLSGALSGQIIVDAEDEEVILELVGVAINYSKDSPIKIISAAEVEISAKKDTENTVKDLRSQKTTDDDSQGEAAIYSKADLKLKGNGILVVTAGYNNGIHTTKDLKIKNLSLKVTAVNNAVKGNDSITIESGVISAISTNGDGLKTERSDISSKGNQKGSIEIDDGTLVVYAAGDGITAAYDYIGNGGSVTIYTGSFSSYTASKASTTSYKGIKVGNVLTINDGTYYVNSYDDGLHADYGTTLENGEKGSGNINVVGGSVTIGVYSPAKSTGMGNFGPRGWGQQQSVSGSDGIHADNTLTISGGVINVDSAYEGLEANFVNITGGKITVYATDDGVNAFKKISTPCITISGGYLDVTVPTSGDTDGIDSNGNYIQTGGVVIVKGMAQGGAWSLDADGTITLNGGTLILFGGAESTPRSSGMTKTVCTTSSVAAGECTISVGGSTYTTTLKTAARGCTVYSDQGSATLSK